MIRLIVSGIGFVAAVGAAAWGIAYLIKRPGRITVSWEGWILETQVITLISAVGALLVGSWIALWLARSFARLPKSLIQSARESKRRRGLAALGQALNALSAEDGTTALASARRAEILLANPALTRALMAKALEFTGNAAEARQYHRALAANPETAAAGVRGLLQDAERSGDIDTALEHAKRAIALNPANGSALRSLLSLQARTADWTGARRTIRDAIRHVALSKEEGQRLEAVTLLAEAEAALRMGESGRARDAAKRAAELDPCLVPAAILSASLLSGAGEIDAAERIVLGAWRAAPNSELAQVWAAMTPDATAEVLDRRFLRLTDASPAHAESRLLTAERAVARRDWAAAREALGSLPDEMPTARTCAVMAAIEKVGNGDDAAGQFWLARALSAPRGGAWHCGRCGAAQARWLALCPGCGAFAAIALQAPAFPAAEGGVRLLPQAAPPARVAQVPAVQSSGSPPAPARPISRAVRSPPKWSDDPTEIVRPEA